MTAGILSIQNRFQRHLLEQACRDLREGAQHACLAKLEFLLTDVAWFSTPPVLCLRMFLALMMGARHEAANIAFYLAGGFAADERASAVRETLAGLADWEPLRDALAGLGFDLRQHDPAVLLEKLAVAAEPTEEPSWNQPPLGRHADAGGPLVVVSLVNGMGNQLFQYAAALRRARCSGGVLKFDLSLFSSDRIGTRPFALGPFAIDVPIATPDDLARVEPYAHVHDLTRPDAALMNDRGDCRLLGCWPSARYFRGVEAELRETLRLRDPAPGRAAAESVAKLRRHGPVIGLHVRRGDHLAPAYRNAYAPLPVDYYRAALRHFPDDRAIVVFSDTAADRDWCAETFADLGGVIEVSRGRSDIEDFAYLAACDHQIVSVSSFSWWAAWLNPNSSKKIVAPHPALGAGPRHAHLLLAGRTPRDWRTLNRDDLVADARTGQVPESAVTPG